MSRMSLMGAGRGHRAGGGYVGPGDVAGWSSAYEYWGLRAYDSSKIGTPCIDICSNQPSADAPVGLTTINIGSDGYIDEAAVTATGFSTYYVDKIYGQVNGRHIVVMPFYTRATLVLNQLGGKPIIRSLGDSIGGQAYETAANAPALAQPFSTAFVVKVTEQGIVLSSGEFACQILGSIFTDNLYHTAGGGRIDYTGQDNVFKSVISVLNGASSSMQVNSTLTAGGDPGSNGITGSTKLGLFHASQAAFGGDDIFEIMIKAGAVSSTNQGLLNTNQHAIGSGW